MDEGEAETYLRLARALPLAALFFGVGLMFGSLGLPMVAVPLVAVGLIGWIGVVLAAATVAAKRRDGRPWFGPRSVSEDTNELLGWGRIDEAMAVLGRTERNVRGQVRALTAATVVALAVSALIVIVRSS